MPYYLGIDTSNYTTSIAVFDDLQHKIYHKKRLLPVKEGSLGLKQSDAVFAHVKQLPQITEELFFALPDVKICAVGVSAYPRNEEGSYMPCFLTGVMAAEEIALTNKLSCHHFSHQCGHIVAALYSADKLELIKKEFIAFHFSGGTTECVYVKPDEERILSTEILFKSCDLKCGQAIDRVGKMLGLPFPAGIKLDELSMLSQKVYKIKPTFKGRNCCVSGVENQCAAMLSQGVSREDVAQYCISFVCEIVEHMVRDIKKDYANLPLIFSGGVMSNRFIRERITKNWGGFFAEPEFSSDNAAGIAILAAVAAVKEGIHG